MTSPDDYTRPERACEFKNARRLKARLDRLRREKGLCAICKHRDTTLGIVHCTTGAGRQFGMCQHDKRLPAFEFDPETVKELPDAA